VYKQSSYQTPGGGGSGSGGQVAGASTFQLPQTGDSGQGYNNEQDIINQEYNNFGNYLNQQEGLANQRFGDLQTNLTNEKATTLTDLTGQQGVANTNLDNQSLKGRQQERMDLTKVRQLLSDLDQRNAARISVTGGGGSINDALAEQFGRTAQQQTGNVLAAGQDYQNQVEVERAKSQNFYDTKKSEIGNYYTQQLAGARQTLQENLANISAERTASATTKQRATLDAYRNYISTRDNARLQAASFQAQYDLWKQQIDAQLKAGAGYAPANAQYNAPQIYQANGFDVPNQTPAVGNVAPVKISMGAKRPEDQYPYATA
jgi:hypothetical protein